MAWYRFVNYKKGCTRLEAASDKVYQLLAHGRWFSPASSTTKTGRHDIAEILLKVALNTINQIKSNILDSYFYTYQVNLDVLVLQQCHRHNINQHDLSLIYPLVVLNMKKNYNDNKNYKLTEKFFSMNNFVQIIPNLHI
jgi:hypothetical protein